MFTNIASFCILFITIIAYLSVLSLAVGGVSAVIRYKSGDGFDAFMSSFAASVKTMMLVFIVLGIFYFVMALLGGADIFNCGIEQAGS